MTDQVIPASSAETNSLRLPVVIAASLILLVAMIAWLRMTGLEIR